MKKLLAMILAASMMVSMTGCGSLFSSGNTSSEAKAKSGDIQITDTFTHKDPEGVEYAVRYAYCSAKDDPEFNDSFKQGYGLDLVQQYLIIYADKDDKPLMQYDYYIAADEENAKKCAEELDPNAFKVDGTVCYSVCGADETQMMIDLNIQYGSLTKNSASEYAAFMKEGYLLLDVE
ncbi:MAG: hypothetical protein KBT01_04530 [Clostridiales bacterium]|nr:hypothetical protein [Candidatus Blautia equi]